MNSAQVVLRLHSGAGGIRLTAQHVADRLIRDLDFLTVRGHFSVMVNEPFQSDGKPVFLSLAIRAANNA